MYERADKAISLINKRLVKLFRELKTLEFDEANVLSATKTCYAKADEYARYIFLELANKVYEEVYDEEEAFLLGIVAGRDIAKMRGGLVDVTAKGSRNLATWLQEVLDSYNPVTKYVYSHEVERKRSRCAEALISTKSPKEADEALKYFSRQTTQYADDIEFGATVEAYKDLGIEEVFWITERDDKVCKECMARDGKKYKIDSIPPKPHYGCRCRILPKENMNEDNN